ncbi:hypothetical protein DFS34DRAFT_633817 [Phlyctochytrium arcticum]|nr:hypothetical protein DFS34DRAFT_633817 [Phlyctochytrium arcticum]
MSSYQKEECPLCFFRLSTRPALKTHLRESCACPLQDRTCGTCGKVCKTRPAAWGCQHENGIGTQGVRSGSSMASKIPCSVRICNQEFTSFSHFDAHFHSEHGRVPSEYLTTPAARMGSNLSEKSPTPTTRRAGVRERAERRAAASPMRMQMCEGSGGEELPRSPPKQSQAVLTPNVFLTNDMISPARTSGPNLSDHKVPSDVLSKSPSLRRQLFPANDTNRHPKEVDLEEEINAMMEIGAADSSVEFDLPAEDTPTNGSLSGSPRNGNIIDSSPGSRRSGQMNDSVPVTPRSERVKDFGSPRSSGGRARRPKGKEPVVEIETRPLTKRSPSSSNSRSRSRGKKPSSCGSPTRQPTGHSRITETTSAILSPGSASLLNPPNSKRSPRGSQSPASKQLDAPEDATLGPGYLQLFKFPQERLLTVNNQILSIVLRCQEGHPDVERLANALANDSEKAMTLQFAILSILQRNLKLGTFKRDEDGYLLRYEIVAWPDRNRHTYYRNGELIPCAHRVIFTLSPSQSGKSVHTPASTAVKPSNVTSTATSPRVAKTGVRHVVDHLEKRIAAKANGSATHMPAAMANIGIGLPGLLGRDLPLQETTESDDYEEIPLKRTSTTLRKSTMISTNTVTSRVMTTEQSITHINTSSSSDDRLAPIPPQRSPQRSPSKRALKVANTANVLITLEEPTPPLDIPPSVLEMVNSTENRSKTPSSHTNEQTERTEPGPSGVGAKRLSPRKRKRQEQQTPTVQILSHETVVTKPRIHTSITPTTPGSSHSSPRIIYDTSSASSSSMPTPISPHRAYHHHNHKRRRGRRIIVQRQLSEAEQQQILETYRASTESTRSDTEDGGGDWEPESIVVERSIVRTESVWRYVLSHVILFLTSPFMSRAELSLDRSNAFSSNNIPAFLFFSLHCPSAISKHQCSPVRQIFKSSGKRKIDIAHADVVDFSQ